MTSATTWLRAGIVVSAMVAPAGIATCTVFNDATVPAGAGGGAGAGGTGGAGATFTDFPTAFLDLDDAVRACRWAFECPTLSRSIGMSLSVPLDTQSLSTCAHWLAGPVPDTRAGRPIQSQVLRCVALAPDCATASACAFVEALAEDDERCSGPFAGAEPYCDDVGTLVDCPESRIHHCDSVRFQEGSECQTSPLGYSTCAFDDCGDAGAYFCAADIQLLCADTLLVGVDCTTAGLVCGSSIFCAADGESLLAEPCEEPAGTTDCSGDVARVCDESVRSHFRCGDLDGGSCEQSGGKGRCVLAESTCSPASVDTAACDGDRVSLCVAGRSVSFDCASVGLTCRPPAGSRSAYCGSPP